MTPGEATLTAALRLLPHGPGFRFIDRLLTLDPGVSAKGEYEFHGDEPFLPGHFPGNPLFPGVLLAEAVAQLAGVAAQSDPNVLPLPDLKLTALKAVKILGSARPGEVLLIEARVLGRLGPLVQAEGTVRVKDQLILSAQLTLAGASV